MRAERGSGLKTLWFFMKPYKKLLIFLVACCLINGFFETFHIALLFPILSASIETGVGAGDNLYFQILQKLAGIIPVDSILIANCILFLLFTVLVFLSRLAYAYLSARTIAKIVRENEQKVFKKYTELDYRYFIDHKQGDLLYIASQAPQSIGSVMRGLTRSALDIVLAVWVLSLLIIISWKGTIAVLIAGAMYFWFNRYLSVKISYVAGRGMQEATQDENVILNEYITGVKQIRANQTSPQWRTKYNRAATTRWSNWGKNVFWVLVPPRVLDLLQFSVVAIMLIMINVLYPDSLFSMIPMLGTFAFAMFRLSPRIQNTGTTLMSVSNSLPNLETVQELLLNQTYNTIKNGDKQFTKLQTSIELRSIGFTHTARETTLSDVSFKIEKDKMTAIVGPSGSGKSTLVDLLLRLYNVDKGAITIDGTNINEYDISTFLLKVGFVGQETFVFNASVKDNIAFGKEHSIPEMLEAAQQANAHGFIELLPQGYDTILGDRGSKLSVGEKQRIAIARAMIRKPQILILDEATSALDNVSEKIVQEAIDKVSQNCTTLVIAHRLSTIRNADMIFVLDQGKIVESGTHQQLIDQHGKYWELYNIQEK